MVSEIAIRHAAPADYDRIVGVVDDWWGRAVHTLLPRLFLDHFHRTSFVAERDGVLAGFLIGLLSPSISDAAYIHFAGVAPECRGSGLARSLYERFFALARADRRTIVRAITSPQNEGSIAFHGSLGFSVSEPVTAYDGASADRVVFARHLTDAAG
ncbi:GNAT family N-acetyltransferase [Amycolatopsis sp. NPDC059027]|uniref:GNAT family N-acetyltransferase n=1 Tax=unclassified Amycolatopsis TaxID=2618356 RepID=UPI00366A62C4